MGARADGARGGRADGGVGRGASRRATAGGRSSPAAGGRGASAEKGPSGRSRPSARRCAKLSTAAGPRALSGRARRGSLRTRRTSRLRPRPARRQDDRHPSSGTSPTSIATSSSTCAEAFRSEGPQRSPRRGATRKRALPLFRHSLTPSSSPWTPFVRPTSPAARGLSQGRTLRLRLGFFGRQWPSCASSRGRVGDQPWGAEGPSAPAGPSSGSGAGGGVSGLGGVGGGGDGPLPAKIAACSSSWLSRLSTSQRSQTCSRFSSCRRRGTATRNVRCQN